MNKINTMAVLFILLLIANIVTSISFYNYKMKVDKLFEYYDEIIEKKSVENSLLKSIERDIKLCIQSEMHQIDSNMKVISKDGKKVKLKDIIGGNSKLIVRYSYLDCDACVRFQLGMLREFLTDIKSENILVLGSYENLREVKFVNDLSVYNVEDEIIPLIEKNREPYFFVIDEAFRATQIHIPRKEHPQLSTLYLQSITNRFSLK